MLDRAADHCKAVLLGAHTHMPCPELGTSTQSLAEQQGIGRAMFNQATEHLDSNGGTHPQQVPKPCVRSHTGPMAIGLGPSYNLLAERCSEGWGDELGLQVGKPDAAAST